MITAITADAPSTSVGLSDYRNRQAAGERAILQDSTPPAPKNAGASDDGRFPQQDRAPAEPALPARKDPSSIFVAAVIAGGLSPTPQTMEQLIQRIGSSPIPAESEARLKDLLA